MARDVIAAPFAVKRRLRLQNNSPSGTDNWWIKELLTINVPYSFVPLLESG